MLWAAGDHLSAASCSRDVLNPQARKLALPYRERRVLGAQETTTGTTGQTSMFSQVRTSSCHAGTFAVTEPDAHLLGVTPLRSSSVSSPFAPTNHRFEAWEGPHGLDGFAVKQQHADGVAPTVKRIGTARQLGDLQLAELWAQENPLGRPDSDPAAAQQHWVPGCSRVCGLPCTPASPRMPRI